MRKKFEEVKKDSLQESVELVGYCLGRRKITFEFAAVEQAGYHSIYVRKCINDKPAEPWEYVKFDVVPGAMNASAYDVLRKQLLIRMGGEDSLKHSYEFDLKFKMFWDELRLRFNKHTN